MQIPSVTEHDTAWYDGLTLIPPSIAYWSTGISYYTGLSVTR